METEWKKHNLKRTWFWLRKISAAGSCPDKEPGIAPDTEIKRELGISWSATADVTIM